MVAWSDTFYTENYGLLVNYAYRRLRDWQLAEDAVQQAFVAAMRNIEKLDRAENVRQWLLTIVRNNTLDVFRKNETGQRAYATAFPDASFELDGTYRAVEPETTDGQVIQAETAEEVQRILAAMKPRVRDILVRFYLKGETIPEIMAADGLTRQTVKSLLHRGREAFRSESSKPKEQPKPKQTRNMKPVYTHGMPAYYQRMKCRCRPCTKAYTAYRKHKTLDWWEVWKEETA